MITAASKVRLRKAGVKDIVNTVKIRRPPTSARKRM